jgi:NAD-dependent deacetylase
MKKHIVVLTGAGVSAESGINTFRDSDGLWEGHNVMEVASPEGFRRNPELVLDFYNQRRRQLKVVKPNQAHIDLAVLESDYKVTIITQNVDDLHERAGSTDVVHLHGELLKIKSTGNPNDIKVWKDDINMGDTCDKGHQLRPHIVWFGEAVPEIDTAVKICYAADILIIIGTSMQVYPAASLIDYVQPDTTIFYIDPKPAISNEGKVTVIEKSATEGMKDLIELLKQKP